MKHSDFAIGTRFTTFTGRWVVTDVGSRVVVAIPEKAGWMAGPPYAVGETVFDEEDIDVCEPDAMTEKRTLGEHVSELVKRDVLPLPPGHDESGRYIEKGPQTVEQILRAHFYTGEPGQHEAIAAAAKLLCVRGPAQPSPTSPVTEDAIALDAAHQIEAMPSDLHPAQKTARIQLIVLDAMRGLAPAPETEE
jgi:hypothetical protein